MNLAEVATGQMAAVGQRRIPKKLPLAEQIHAELPAKREEGRIEEEKKQWEAGQAQERELTEKDIGQRESQTLAELAQEQEQHEENLAELARQHTETMAQRTRELDIQEREAEKAEGVQAIGLGLSGAKMLSEWAKSSGGEYAGYAAPMVAGFGVGYGVTKLTGKKLYGAAAGAGAGALASVAQTGTMNAISMTLSSIAGFLGGLI
jgi:hypothetical protein